VLLVLLILARSILEGVVRIEAALGRQRALPLGLVRVGGQRHRRPFPRAASAHLAGRSQGAEDRAHGDRLGDMVEDRITFALH